MKQSQACTFLTVMQLRLYISISPKGGSVRVIVKHLTHLQLPSKVLNVIKEQAVCGVMIKHGKNVFLFFKYYFLESSNVHFTPCPPSSRLPGVTEGDHAKKVSKVITEWQFFIGK